MKRTFSPLFSSPAVVSARQTTFHKIDEKIVLEAPGKLVRQLIKACDGTQTLHEIVRLLRDEWDEHSVRGFIKELCRLKVLVDGRYLSETFWKVTENPSRFPSKLTEGDVATLVERARKRQRSGSSDNVYQVSPSPFGQLLEHRRSVRHFSGEPVEIQSIIKMLWSAYGEINLAEGGDLSMNCRRTVPSAGALYPIRASLVLFKNTGDLSPGIYKVLLGTPNTVGLNLVSRDTGKAVRSFVDPIILDGAHGVVILSGSLNVASEKYGNRSMLFVPLEAGHAAQNVHISALESEVATVEVGGFMESLIAEAIKLPKSYYPLTTIVFGREKKVTTVDDSNSGVEVNWAIPMADRYRLPFAMASARVVLANRDWSSGRAISPKLALTKAVSEAREWAACGCISPELVHSRIANLETAVDPRGIIKFHPAQYRLRKFPFKPFDEDVEYAWVRGKNELRESEVHVLADCVYFPYNPKTPRYAFANSSGVAAHPKRQQAIKNGVLELVERDSFMIAYLAKLILPTVSEKTLPGHIQKRIRSLSKMGFRVWVKDLSLDLAPVVFVFIQNEELAFTGCAGCADFDREKALDHALMEVESLVLYRLADGPLKPVGLSRVRFPIDHGRLYGQRQFFRKADFLAQSQEQIAFGRIGRGVAQSWQDLLDRFTARNWSLITVQLDLAENLGGNSGLQIVRSIVPGMVPISFGHREEPCGMERIYRMAKEINGVSISYQDLPKFPHPYT